VVPTFCPKQTAESSPGSDNEMLPASASATVAEVTALAGLNDPGGHGAHSMPRHGFRKLPSRTWPDYVVVPPVL